MVKAIPILFAVFLLTACQAFNSSGSNANSDAEVNNAPITEAKSSNAEIVPPMPTPVISNTTTANSVAVDNGFAKTLVIPQGISLMQVFRDNNLNIGDLVAMTKVDPNSVLSTFQPGDKVQVKLNNAQKVQSLSLPNGGRFLLQPSGAYTYSAN